MLLSAIVAVALSASAQQRLVGERGPAGELRAEQTRTHDRSGVIPPALRIDLPSALQQTKEALAAEADETGPRRIGFHRDVPKAFQGDLLPALTWTPTSNGATTATLLVSSPQAKSIRVALRADLPPAGALRFFHPDGGEGNVVMDPVVTGEDLRSLGMRNEDYAQKKDGPPARTEADEFAPDPEALWSPSMQGDVIGIEITLPSGVSWQQASLRLEKIAHRFRGLEGPIPSGPIPSR